MPSAAILEAFEQARAAVTEFVVLAHAGGMTPLDNHEFVDLAPEIEALRRQLETVDYPILDRVTVRDLRNEQWLTKTPAGFLATTWRLTPGEAAGRAREAAALAPRPALSGPPLPPRYPATATARRLGILSRTQAAAIITALDALPDTIPAEQIAHGEQTLLDAAHVCDAGYLRRIGRALLTTYTPEPTPQELDRDTAREDRRRCFDLIEDPDGMGSLHARLTPEALALATTLITTLAAPKPADDPSGRDQRTPTQRRHDAFLDLPALGLHAGELTTATGAPVQLVITMTGEQFQSRTGLATTSTGQQLRVDTALLLADQCCVAWAVHKTTGAVLNLGRGKRLATIDQGLALVARDKGCAFPGCDAPAEWCDRHHIIEWLTGGPTDIDNLILLCRYHHRRHLKQGWHIKMIDGIPWFIPPPLIDPEQKPIRNIRGLGNGPFE